MVQATPVSSHIDAAIQTPALSDASFNYEVIILMENNGLCNILTTCGGGGTFETRLAQAYSLATHYTAVDHSSLPNYLALTTGNTFDEWSRSDCAPTLCKWYPSFPSISNIVDRIETAGLTWKAYMEDYPGSGSACARFSSADCSLGGCYVGDGGLGDYAAHHDPFVYPRDIVNSQSRCSRIVAANSIVSSSPEVDDLILRDLGSTATASDFMWLTPNLRDDMHDSSVNFGDAYLSQLVPRILNSYIFRTQKAALFITFDEGKGQFPSDFVYSAWAGPVVKPKYQSSQIYDHYSFLKTTESVWNLPPLTANDTSARSMAQVFMPPHPSVPALIGWGGVGLGESLTDIQSEMRSLNSSGYNAVRVDFGPTCTTVSDTNVLGSYDAAKLGRVIGLAKQYSLWIIVDYHGYTDLERVTTELCWLSFWKSLVANFTSSYSRMIWEPLNEPHMANSTDVAGLSSAYQNLVNELRALGDTHWIVVQNLCSSICGFDDANLARGYPTVSDPLGTLQQGGRIFISLHSYMQYKYYSQSWNNATAEKLANEFYHAIVTGMKNTGWPVLNTEGGADPIAGQCSRGVVLPSNLCAPDQVLVGSAGYSVVTFHFIQTLTNLYDANPIRRVDWLWWPAGGWVDTPGAGAYGALQCASKPVGWGCLLRFVPLSALTRSPPRSSGPFALSFQGYDFDGAGEERLSVNGVLVAKIPQVPSPASGERWVAFSLNITSYVVEATNTISFTHANSDCGYIDEVRGLVVTSAAGAVYSNATVESVNTPANCANTLAYAFTIRTVS